MNRRVWIRTAGLAAGAAAGLSVPARANPAGGSQIGRKLAALGVELPAAASPVANYQPAVCSGSLVFLAGAIAKDQHGRFISGKVGDSFDVQEAYGIARKVGITLLGSLLLEIGDLDKVERFVKVEGFVNCGPDFTQHSQVINGCSDLLVEIFGERGKHARFAVGASSLPFGAPVEIAAVAQLRA